MYLVISKRFEISLAYRYCRGDWTEEKNRAVFGKKAAGPHGFGGNFTAYFVFHGPVDSRSGMLINVAIIKKRINRLLAERYDHRYLNRDTPPFDHIVPTPEHVARQLFEEARPLFADETARLVVCHLNTSPADEATAYSDGRVERHRWLELSAARRTWSPRLSDEENQRLFGIAASPSGHGHAYRLRATVTGDVDPDHGMIVLDSDFEKALGDLHALLDHRNLTTDVPELKGMPLTTECLARFMFDRLAESLPVTRVRLWENSYFFAEYLSGSGHFMGVTTGFRAAHRLHSPHLSDQENSRMYGKCNNPQGHGHLYRVEATIGGDLDERSGTLFALPALQEGMAGALAAWDYKHLDLDTNDFADMPSTGENIVQTLWPRVEKALGHTLHRLRLWETPNNRFTLRRTSA